jgi:hypothetical protein
MRLLSATIFSTFLVLLIGPNGFSQNFSRGIAASYRVAGNVTYMKSGSWEATITIPGGKHGWFTRAENERAFAAIESFLKAQSLWPAE